MPFFLRVSHITSFLLLPAASHGCWPVTNWQLLGAGRGLELPISPQRQLVKQHLQSPQQWACRGVKVQRKPAVCEREAAPRLGGDGHWVAVRRESQCGGGSQVSPHVFFPRVFGSWGKQTFLTASLGRRS